jgi:chromosome segregation ATPase
MAKSGLKLVAMLTAVVAISGCAPSFSGRSLGAGEAPSSEAAAEVQVVEVDPEQVRAAEMRELKQQVARLRGEVEVTRARAEAAEAAAARLDAAGRESRADIEALQAELIEVRMSGASVLAQSEKAAAQSDRALSQSDKAFAQSEKALALATEFLSNLVAARDEQRIQLERNRKSFGEMDQRFAALDTLLTDMRRQHQADLATSGTRSEEMASKFRQADQELARLNDQLIVLERQNEETRAAIDSGTMLRMLRDLEGTQRDMAVLRGVIEDMQREQDDARKRLQNYYLDLDTRIQALQEQQRERAAAQSDSDSSQ